VATILTGVRLLEPLVADTRPRTLDRCRRPAAVDPAMRATMNASPPARDRIEAASASPACRPWGSSISTDRCSTDAVRGREHVQRRSRDTFWPGT
jgi:hypothetical protein